MGFRVTTIEMNGLYNMFTGLTNRAPHVKVRFSDISEMCSLSSWQDIYFGIFLNMHEFVWIPYVFACGIVVSNFKSDTCMY